MPQARRRRENDSLHFLHQTSKQAFDSLSFIYPFIPPPFQSSNQHIFQQNIKLITKNYNLKDKTVTKSNPEYTVLFPNPVQNFA